MLIAPAGVALDCGGGPGRKPGQAFQIMPEYPFWISLLRDYLQSGPGHPGEVSLSVSTRPLTSQHCAEPPGYDDRLLYLVVNPNGSRWWRFKYKCDGKKRGISLGVYPDVTLQSAGEQLQNARGIDPSAQRRTVRTARADTFKAIAEEWLEMQAERLAPITMTKARWILGSFLYPRLGSRPIAEIAAPEVLAVLRPIESRGMNETTHRALQRCGQIFRYAIATGRATRDITSDLRGALAPVVVENRAPITEPAKIGALLRAIDDYIGHPTTLMALKLSPLVFLRPSELRAAEWRVPAARMKMRERHIVPLASQAVAILRELRSVTSKAKYLFPSLRTSDRAMSVNTVNAA